MGQALRGVFLGSLVVGGVACAQMAKPDAQLADSEAAVRVAEGVGAKQVPQAALEDQLANEELQHARDLMKDDKNEEASLQLMRAKADAELALALTRVEQAKGSAKSAQEQLETLQPSSR